MSVQSLYKIRILVGLFLTTTFFLSAQAAVPASTYVGRGTSPDPNDNVTVSINVPNDNSDSLYFHFLAPADQTWAAFGLGGQMAGTLIFVTYASKDGNNVTVSPRIGTGHVMPKHTSDVQVDVLSGSGIIDGTFVVNAKCNKCRSWNGGKINIDSTSQAMIWAAGSSGTLNSDDLNAQISKHEGYDFFNINLKAATGAGGVPVVNSSSTIIGDGPPLDGHGRFRGATGFHAFLMVGAFLIVFPGGLLMLRVFEKVWLHWGIQSLALLMTILGMGVGIAISKKDSISPNLTAPHQIIGFAVVGFALVTWTVGFTGHLIYKKTQRPAKIMKGHRVLGPLTMGLGLINCISGFRFAGSNIAMIVFIVAMFLMLIFVGTVLFLKRRQRARKAPLNTPAAANFREGHAAAPSYTGEAPLPLYGQGGIPLHSYVDNQAPPVYR
ncbi:hypothetical protein A1O7_01942 [Cladophialophora yegresii CBS 114405]|uniref:DOMON domain-containing protein n=1 Tax=Cladophialophora yegresii CBS 114405 TaxID=1182544 RepID=W9WT53_9EURO|nr:uncharacterized protein A1O7_01942 [Cladophialophora yegresii CBS 114405]EXJ61514.1 hypothetical protein A1O7_01942 [Cladophialophora yegresii CBS 114405]